MLDLTHPYKLSYKVSGAIFYKHILDITIILYEFEFFFF